MYDEKKATSDGACNGWDAKSFAERWITGEFNDGSLFDRLKGMSHEQSDTPRKAGGLMSWAASKAVALCV